MPHGSRPNRPNPEALRAKWVRDLEQITQEVYSIHHYRQLWRELAQITQNAELPPSIFFDALGVWYAATQTSAVRRQLDQTRGAVSLRRLLSSLAANPGAITRDWHVGLWIGDKPTDRAVIDLDGWAWVPFEREANTNFDRFSTKEHPDHLSSRRVRDDIGELDAVGEVVKRHVDQVVAHTALYKEAAVPTYDELNAAIDSIAETVNKYTSLLRAQTVAFFEPAIQGQDWTAIFRRPWIRA